MLSALQAHMQPAYFACWRVGSYFLVVLVLYPFFFFFPRVSEKYCLLLSAAKPT